MTSRPLIRLAAAMLVAGCAAQPGTGFATLAGGEVAAPAILGPARLDEAGRWKTNNGYVLALAGGKLGVALREVALKAPGEATGGGAAVTFDPANPPPGYTFCHNTDCHTADGQVKTFDEIRAELAGGGGAAPARTVVVARPAVALLDWPLTGAAGWRLAGCEPHCFLPQGALSEAVLGLERLTASGTVAPAAGGEPRAFSLDLAVGGAAFPAAVTAVVGAAGPQEVTLTGTFTLTDKLFDGLPWERLLQAPGPIDLDADAAAAETLTANLAKSGWAARLGTP